MVTNENEFYINEEDLSKDGTLFLPANDLNSIQLWYEDNDYLVNTLGIYSKSIDEEGDTLLTPIHDFPICIYKVLEKNAKGENDNEESFTASDTKQFVMVKYKIAGVQKIDEVAYSRYKTSIMPTNESLNMSSNGGRYDPTHLSNGWTAPTLRKNKTQITALLQRMLDRCTLRAAYDKTGWQYDSVENKLCHITPSHNYYLGKKGYAYVSKAGSREKYISAQIKLILNSPLYALLKCGTISGFTRGLFNVETVSHAMVMYGQAGLGKTTLMQAAMSFFGPYSMRSRGSNVPNAIDGTSTLAGTEFLMSARNNAVVGFNEFDAMVRELTIDKALLFLSGGGRIVKNQSADGGVNMHVWDSLFLATANDQPSKIYPGHSKNEAFASRLMEMNIDDPVICRPENGKNGFDINEIESVLFENYGHGYDMLMEYLTEEKIKSLNTTFHKTLSEFKANKDIIKSIGKNNIRLLHLFTYMSIGALIMKDLFSEEASTQATQALNLYIKSLSKPDNIRNPKTKAIEVIKQLKHSIVMYPRAFVWDTYAYDRNNHEDLTEREIKEYQRKQAKSFTIDSAQKIGIIKQDRPFENQYDFEGELLLNVNTKNTSVITIGTNSIPVNEIISAIKELDLCFEEKNGIYTKKIITKKTSKKERAYFDNIPSDVLRIKLKPLMDLEIDEDDYSDSENNETINKEIDEISKVAKRENTNKGNKNKEVADIFSDMLSVLDKGKGSDLLNVVDMSKAKRITKEEFSVIFPEAK